MRTGVPIAAPLLALALVTGGCDDETTGTTDDGGAADVAEDTVTPEDAELPDDAGDLGEDVVEEADSFACPDVLPEDVTLTREQSMLITVDIHDSGEGVGVSTAVCRYEPPLEWATQLGQSDGCRVLHWLPAAVPVGSNLVTGEISVDIGGTVLTVAPAEGSIPCYRPTSGGPVSGAPAGTTVRVWSTGGADVPAFDLSATVPELPAVAEPLDGDTLTACLPWHVAWTAADVSDVRVVFQTTLEGSRRFALSCRDLTVSPLTVPAELTTLWTTARDRADLEVRSVHRVVSTTDPAVTLEVTHGTLRAPSVNIGWP
ncbi:MAG: hypothetical protein JXB32_23535 [Deltaproteobacteria bacterium]|nr:hypothetical protein [Deltaproteobacteria bacterium]